MPSNRLTSRFGIRLAYQLATKAAGTEDELASVAATIGDLGLTGAEREAAADAYRKRRAELVA